MLIRKLCRVSQLRRRSGSITLPYVSSNAQIPSTLTHSPKFCTAYYSIDYQRLTFAILRYQLVIKDFLFGDALSIEIGWLIVIQGPKH